MWHWVSRKQSNDWGECTTGQTLRSIETGAKGFFQRRVKDKSSHRLSRTSVSDISVARFSKRILNQHDAHRSMFDVLYATTVFCWYVIIYVIHTTSSYNTHKQHSVFHSNFRSYLAYSLCHVIVSWDNPYSARKLEKTKAIQMGLPRSCYTSSFAAKQRTER